jgi:hypothetical protein
MSKESCRMSEDTYDVERVLLYVERDLLHVKRDLFNVKRGLPHCKRGLAYVKRGLFYVKSEAPVGLFQRRKKSKSKVIYETSEETYDPSKKTYDSANKTDLLVGVFQRRSIGSCTSSSRLYS